MRSMTEQSVVAAVVSFIVSGLTAGLTGLFAIHRDRMSRKSEQRISYLVDVYRTFSKANHHPRLLDIAEDIQQAIADIQLFGTPYEIKLAITWAKEMDSKQTAELNPLLGSLRQSLRRELKVKSLSQEEKILWFRID